MTFTYISISHGNTSLRVPQYVIPTRYLLLYYSAYNLTAKMCLLEYRSIYRPLHVVS